MKLKTKRCFYLSLFILLGLILQGLIHAGLEIWYLNLLMDNFDSYGLGLSWRTWVLIHHAVTILLLLLGIGFGWWQGKFWWKRIYQKNKT